MRTTTLMFVASMATLIIVAILWMQQGRQRPVRRPVEVAAAATRPPSRTPTTPQHAPLTWSLDGPPAATARVIPLYSAEQWSRHLRDEVCACRDFACASAVQHTYAANFGGIDFGSGDQERIEPAARGGEVHRRAGRRGAGGVGRRVTDRPFGRWLTTTVLSGPWR